MLFMDGLDGVLSIKEDGLTYLESPNLDKKVVVYKILTNQEIELSVFG
jgi:hypothetical protein